MSRQRHASVDARIASLVSPDVLAHHRAERAAQGFGPTCEDDATRAYIDAILSAALPPLPARRRADDATKAGCPAGHQPSSVSHHPRIEQEHDQ